MKGYDLDYNFKDKLLNEYNNEYGLNIYKEYADDEMLKYEMFFNTRNNFHKHIKNKK